MGPALYLPLGVTGADVSSGIEKFAAIPPGTDLGASAWHRVTQSDVDAFARLTRDEDPYHNDPEWAKQASPFGATISFGFFTMSLLTYFAHQVLDEHGIVSGDDTQMLNFGFNRVRLPEAVPVGSEIRGRFVFSGMRKRHAGGVEITLNTSVEICGNDRPALVAEWLFVAVSTDGTPHVD